MTIFVILFSTIYESFSHGVYSKYMILAFIFPLIGLILSITYKNKFIKRFPNKISTNIFDASLATLTAGGLLQGFLEIYGTTNKLIIIYPAVGLSLLLISIIVTVLLFFLILLQEEKYKKQEFLKLLFLLILSIISYCVSKCNYILMSFLFVIACKKIDVKKVIKFDIKLKSLLIIITIIFYKIGLAENIIMYRENGTIRNSLGFSHPNSLGAFLFAICLDITQNFIYIKNSISWLTIRYLTWFKFF